MEHKRKKILILTALTALLIVTVFGCILECMRISTDPSRKSLEKAFALVGLRWVAVPVCMAELTLILDAVFHFFGKEKTEDSRLGHSITTVLAVTVLAGVAFAVCFEQLLDVQSVLCFLYFFLVGHYLVCVWVYRSIRWCVRRVVRGAKHRGRG